ncbi:MAG TPA: hypothetical protein VF181_12780 [Balneolaceae bacterium]
MKKTLLLLIFVLSVSNVFAQQIEQNRGEPPVKQNKIILPETGDFALGFDAVPFLEYLGNVFNGTQNNSIGADFLGNRQQIFAKYFLSEDMAIRGRLRLEQDMITNRNRVLLDNQTFPQQNIEVTDEWTNYSTFVRVGGGIEFRRGTGRLVGVFGGELSFLYQTSSAEYGYGNSITELNQSPSSTFGRFINGRFERIVEQKSNKQMGAGLNAFAGVEYFIAPKLSVGAEFTLGLDFIKAYREQSTYEYWNSTTESVETIKFVSEGGNDLSFYTGNYGGSINLMFYF